MKKIQIILAAMSLLIVSCKKNTTGIIATTSVNVIHAMVDAGNVKVNPGGGSAFTFIRSTDEVSYGSGKLYSAYVGNRTYVVASTADTTKSYFTGTLNPGQSVNTLYLIGQLPNVDTMFREEKNIPFINKNENFYDSSIYVRFVNLSPNSPAVNVKINTGTGNEVSGLTYKTISEFKKYTALKATANYIFEVRDATTNTLLTSYTLNTSNRFKTVAIIIKGVSGVTSGTNAYNTSLISYF